MHKILVRMLTSNSSSEGQTSTTFAWLWKKRLWRLPERTCYSRQIRSIRWQKRVLQLAVVFNDRLCLVRCRAEWWKPYKSHLCVTLQHHNSFIPPLPLVYTARPYIIYLEQTPGSLFHRKRITNVFEWRTKNVKRMRVKISIKNRWNTTIK